MSGDIIVVWILHTAMTLPLSLSVSLSLSLSLQSNQAFKQLISHIANCFPGCKVLSTGCGHPHLWSLHGCKPLHQGLNPSLKVYNQDNTARGVADARRCHWVMWTSSRGTASRNCVHLGHLDLTCSSCLSFSAFWSSLPPSLSPTLYRKMEQDTRYTMIR